MSRDHAYPIKHFEYLTVQLNAIQQLNNNCNIIPKPFTGWAPKYLHRNFSVCFLASPRSLVAVFRCRFSTQALGMHKLFQTQSLSRPRIQFRFKSFFFGPFFTFTARFLRQVSSLVNAPTLSLVCSNEESTLHLCPTSMFFLRHLKFFLCPFISIINPPLRPTSN